VFWNVGVESLLQKPSKFEKPGNVWFFKIFPQNLLQNYLLPFNKIRVMEQRLLCLYKFLSPFRNVSAPIVDRENCSSDQIANIVICTFKSRV